MTDFNEDLHIGLKALCLFMPPAGLILYFFFNEKDPTKSKSAGIWALAGFSFAIIFRLLAGSELFG